MKIRLLTMLLLGAASLALVACSQTPSPAEVGVAAPWPDQEHAVYVIRNQQGTAIGTGDLRIDREGDVYVLRHLYQLPGGVVDDITMRVRADDLKPIGGHREVTTSQGVTVIDTTYHDGKLSIKAKTPTGEDKSAEIDVPADAYDNDQALFLWRSLPFADGLKVAYTNIVAANALKPKVTLSVVGQEQVTAPAGEFATWKLEMVAGQQKQHLWYAVAAPHHLVKYDNGTTIFLLERHP